MEKEKVISQTYQEITLEQAMSEPLSEAWQNPAIANQQDTLASNEFEKWKAGKPLAPFDALQDCMKGLSRGQTILEIGCGTGYYLDVITWLCGGHDYFGVDYSAAAIDLAIEKRGPHFRVMDATLLDFPNRAFSVVISGSVLLHIVDWRTALKEAARVCSDWLILHRTPVSDQPTKYFFKNAYGVKCVEIHFNRQELLDECALNGFSLSKSVFVTAGQESLVLYRELFHHPV